MQAPLNQHEKTPATALAEGKVPTTAQAARMVDLAELRIDDAKRTDLSVTGKQVLEKAQDVLETGKRIMVEKNPEEELQELYVNLSAGTTPLSGSTQEVSQKAKSKFDSLSQETRQAISEVSTVTALFLRSPEFRMFVRELSASWSDFLEVLRGTAKETYHEVRGVAKEEYSNLPPQVKDTDNAPGSTDEAQAVAEQSKEPVKRGADRAANQVQAVPEKLQSNLEDNFSTERFNAVMDRLKAAVDKIRVRPEWQQAVDHLLNIAYRMRARVSQGLDQANAKVKQAGSTEHVYEPDNEHLAQAQLNAKKIIEHLTNGKSLDYLISELNALFVSMGNDPAVQGLFDHINAFVTKTLHESEFVQSPAFREEGRRVADEARSLQDRPWMANLENVTAETNDVLTRISQDKLLNRFANDWSDLMAAMFLDSRGHLAFKPELLTDTGKILKFVAERFNRLQISKIVQSDDEVDLVVDNIVLNVANVLPSQSRVRFTSRLNLEESTQPSYLLELKFAKIQLDVETMRFWYHKKTFPKLTDTGYASATAGEDGLTLWIDIVPAKNAEKNVFDVARVSATLPDLSFKVKDAKYGFLYKLLTPIAKNKIRKSIEEEIQKDTNEFLLRLDSQFKNMMDATRDTLIPPSRLEVEKDKTLPAWSSPAFDVDLHRETGPKQIR